MPPKKSKSEPKQEEEKKPSKSVPKPKDEKDTKPVTKKLQKTLDSDKLVDDKPQKSRSKQFQAGDTITGSSLAHRWKLGDGKTPKKVTISSWNVNGIRSVLAKKDLQNYVTSKNPDMICINETKIDQAAYDSSPIQLEGYHPYWNFCKSSAGYSGVAIFSKHLPISVVEDLPEPEHSQEGRVLTLEF